MSVREVGLIEFQQRIGAKIPSEDDEEYYKPFSSNKNTLRRRRWKEKKNKSRKDYEEYLRDIRNNMRDGKKSF